MLRTSLKHEHLGAAMALIPPGYLDCVVAIGQPNSEGEPTWIATGFFYGLFNSVLSEDQHTYRVYLVTNRHVLTGLTQCVIKANGAEGGAGKVYRLALMSGEETMWYPHPDPSIDVAVVPVNYNLLVDEGMKVNFFQSDRHSDRREELRTIGTAEGDAVFVLGFPFSIPSVSPDEVIVRSGTVARIRSTLHRTEPDFLIDVTIFPGNSGGPVVSRPEFTAISGTSSRKSATLIGIVKAYLPYNDVSISQQTQLPRVVFTENSGLALAHPVDCIETAIEVHRATLPPGEAPQTARGTAENDPVG